VHTEHTHEVLQRLVTRACDLLAAETAALLVRDRQDPRSTLTVAGHNVGSDVQALRPAADTGVIGEVLRRGEPVIVQDYQESSDPLPHEAAAEIGTIMAVPISWGGTVRAALSVGSRGRERAFGQGDVEQLTALAHFAGLALENAETRGDLEDTLGGVVRAMAIALDLRDGYTAEHSEDVVGLAVAVGERLDMAGRTLVELEFAARLHDLGKIGIPDEILRKPDALSADEWDVMRHHPVLGERILKQVPGLDQVALIVRSAHERWDGQGYPDGLEGEAIPRGSRVIFACDAYHAMTSDRSYRGAMGDDTAVDELQAGSGSQFDPAVVHELLAALHGDEGRRAAS
jgi:HD-GYP domain-containing protein (c-di-GMP phosphodiesterase class II)